MLALPANPGTLVVMGSSSSAPIIVADGDKIYDHGVRLNRVGKLGALAAGDLRPADADSRRNAGNRKRFVSEDKVLKFNWTTFWEEFFCQTLGQKLALLAVPFIVWVCGVNGAKLTQFYPGQHPTDPELSVTGDFIVQMVVNSLISVPTTIFMIMALTGNLNDAIAPEGAVLPYAEIYLPVAMGLIRQVVIAVKYAYIPRRRMRGIDRKTGRHPKAFEQDLMGFWSGLARRYFAEHFFRSSALHCAQLRPGFQDSHSCAVFCGS